MSEAGATRGSDPRAGAPAGQVDAASARAASDRADPTIPVVEADATLTIPADSAAFELALHAATTAHDEGRPTRPSLPPSHIGRFAILAELGAGGMGVVYKAIDPTLQRLVALKVLHRKRTTGDALLMREAQAMAKLAHPSVITIYDVGEHEGRLYLAMELCAGETLKARLQRRTLSLRQTLDLMVAAGRGLAAAHRAGIVHRDFKPANVMVDPDGRVRVLDFGLAVEPHSVDPAAPRRLAGTPAYMSPEQYTGGVIGPQSDQFSFCVVLHEALYGARPFSGEDMSELRDAIVTGRMRPAPVGHAVPAWLRRILLRGLSLRPADRYPSMDALLADIARKQRAARLRRSALAATLALAVALGAAGLWLAWQRYAAAEAQHMREAAAAERLAAMNQRIDALLAAGRASEADETFATFAGLEAFQGTRAMAQAWLEQAARQARQGRVDEALASHAQAYIAAVEPAEQQRALLGLAHGFAGRWSWRELGVVLARMGARLPPAETLALRLRAALVERRFADALAMWAQASPVSPEALAADAAPLVAALGAALPTALVSDRVYGGDLDGDGTDDLLVYDAERRSLRALRADARLSPLWQHPLPAVPGDFHDAWILPVAAGAPPLVLLYLRTPGVGGGQAVLVRMDARRLEVLGEWPEDLVNTAIAADLTGGGRPEILIGIGPYSRRLYRLVLGPGSVERVPIDARIDRLGSDIRSLVAADLDGDGARELAVAVGPWQAYDLRVLRPGGAPGEMQQVGRHKLGYVTAMAALRTARGTDLVVRKDDAFPSRRVFPDSAPFGAPAGLYRFELHQDGLVQAAYTALPVPGGSDGFGRETTLVGDLDGDGLDDVVMNVRAHERRFTFLCRQRADGSFVPVLVGGLEALAMVAADGDPAAELVVRLLDDGRVWVLGAGTAALPALQHPGAAPGAAPGVPGDVAPDPAGDVAGGIGAQRMPPAAAADPALAKVWQRAEELVAMGLLAQAAESFEDLATVATGLAVSRWSRYRAAQLRDALGEDERAAAGYQEAAAEPALTTAALRGAVAALERSHRFGEALPLLDRLLARPDLAPEAARALAASRRQWQALAASAPPVRVDPDQPLAGAWRIEDPLALRRDPGQHVLGAVAMGDRRPIARLPLEPVEDRLSMNLELDVVRSEWAAGMRVVLAPRAGGDAVGLAIKAVGGGGFLQRQLYWYLPGDSGFHGMSQHGAMVTAASAGEPLRVTAALDVVPGLGMLLCSITDGQGRVLQRARVPWRGAALAGGYDLVIESDGEPGIPEPNQLAVHFRRVELGGVRVADAAPATPARAAIERGHRALIEGDPAAALAAYTQAGDEVERGGAGVGLAMALALLHRPGEAAAALAAAIARDPAGGERTLARLLRAPGVPMGPLVRQVVGARYWRTYWTAWHDAVHHHEGDPAVLASLTTELGEPGAGASGPPGAEERYMHAWLLLQRGVAWLRLGHYGAARADLGWARELASAPMTAPVRASISVANLRAEICRYQAVVEATSGRREQALAYARCSLAEAESPEIAADVLDLHPAIRALQAGSGSDALARP
jgi:tetratricopeptide (TPR) repeat protein